MKRFAALIFWFFLASFQPARAASEIGYVEDFSGKANRYRVIHNGEVVQLRLCLPLYNGDNIEALDDKGRITLRLMDHDAPVIWSRADKDTKLSVVVPKTSFWSGLMQSTLAALSPFDEQKRERILTTIRNDGNDEFGAPLLQGNQIISAGPRTLVLGWVKSSTIAEISITAKKGRKLVNKSKAIGGLWTSPSLDFKPGLYHIVLDAGPEVSAGDIEVVAPSAIPQLPAELTQADIPDPLRHTAQAIWLAAQKGGRYRLEALQLIAGDRGARPAAVLAEALIAGRAIELPQ